VRSLVLGLTFFTHLLAADLCEQVRFLVEEEARKQDIPGISVTIVRDNQLACSIAFGWADLEQRIALTTRSRHRLASLSKPVTAALTMWLVQEGRLALDDSVRKFMPELPSRYDPVTIRRLLSHQSGIREYSGLEEVFSTRHYSSLAEAARSIFIDSPLLFEPGTKTAYTTYGYTLLGAVLERATGQSFKQNLEARFPGFALDDFTALVPARVRPYRKSSVTGWENAPAFDASNKYSGGGMVASADEYAKFLIEVSSGRLLNEGTLKTMWTAQKLSDGSLVPYATLGWATGLRGTDRYVTHGGLQPGTTTVMHWFPNLGVGSVVLCNAEGPDLDGLQERILKLLTASKAH
jgi:serine beta-lactamase-like protein LACTB, mitochondrial